MTEMTFQDPRTLEPEQLREAVKQTDHVMRRMWVLQAVAFRRIRDEKLYTRWKFKSWNEYLASDLPEMAEVTIQQMIQALNYGEENVPTLVGRAVDGGMPGHTPGALPGWRTLIDLARLENKVQRPISIERAKAKGQLPIGVPKEAVEELRDKALSGEMTDSEVRKEATRLGKGIVRRENFVKDPVGDKVRKVGDDLAACAHELRSLKRPLAAGNVDPLVGKGLVSDIQGLLIGIRFLLGDELFEAMVAETRAPAKASRRLA